MRNEEPPRERPSPEISVRFAGHPSADSLPELLLRRQLHAAGYRYRINYRIPGLARKRMDIAFTRKRLVVLVDGCFWHGCPLHYKPPKRNPEWWEWKVELNRARDLVTEEELVSRGWSIIRVWEHEVLDGTAFERVRTVLEAASGNSLPTERQNGAGVGCQEIPKELD